MNKNNKKIKKKSNKQIKNQNFIHSRKIKTKIKNKTKKGFVKLNCSPETKKNKINSYSCYTDENLHKLRDLWNARHPDDLIKTNDNNEIWIILKNKYSSVCNKESCWLNKLFGGKNKKYEKELLDSFAPEAPKEWKKHPNEWLSSLDIINVMNQYEKSYKCFEFIGPSPIDYDTHKIYGECVWEELCHFNLQDQINKKKNKIGIIFNLDPHYKKGSHWVSLFINIKKKTIYYFDSNGETSPKQIKKLSQNIINQGKKLKYPINFKYDENHPVQHQYENTECGIYSLYFIIYMLEDKINGHYLKHHILPDKYIEKYRKVFYNEEL